jgi:hypothetical protein
MITSLKQSKGPHESRVDNFREWAVKQARTRNPDQPGQYDNLLLGENDIFQLGSGRSVEGIDHAFLASGYAVWGPLVDKFDETDLGGNEYAIVTAPNGPLPELDPSAISVEDCPVKFYSKGSNHRIITIRDIRPNTKEWEWFASVLDQVPDLPVTVYATLLPQFSEYTLAYSYSSFGPSRHALIPNTVVRENCNHGKLKF